MSLKEVYIKLENLAAHPSTLEKEELLATYLQDELFLKVCKYALDPLSLIHI